jgi:uncharacterized BrkB/YihY/UPF0761 family membrane protein
MTATRIVGLAVLVVGAVLLVFAYQASQAPLDQLAEGLTGRYSDKTMWYLVGGIAAVIVGGGLAAFGRAR